jgi:hypothetical protein
MIALLGLASACDEPDGEGGQAPEGGAPNYCLELDGDGDYVQIAHHDALDLDQQWTIECWAVLDENSQSRPLIRKGDAQTETASFFLYGNDAEGVVSAGYRINGDNTVQKVKSAATIGAEIWHHLALVNDGERLWLYEDGEVSDSVPTEQQPLVGDLSDLIFGANLRSGAFHLGQIDEVRISHVARYDSDFVPAQRFEVDDQTIALWHFDEGEGDGVFDEVLDLRGDIVGDVAFVLR